MNSFTRPEISRIGFISTRVAGTDGVSLEIRKWADVIERMGLECFYITGESDRPEERTVLIDEMHFAHPLAESISARAFGHELRPAELTADIMTMARLLREKITEAIEMLDLHVVIAENCLTIPMHLPLGVALVQVLQQQPVACLAHHHDFHWERARFLINCVRDILQYAFPPALPQIQHAVINSVAGEEFSRRTGLSCRIIPNVMDFANPPAPADDYAKSFRQAIGMDDDELLILQPTRVVARKGIEHSIELVRRLDHGKARLVITHASGDEGDAYAARIKDFAELMGVNVTFADRWISDERGTDAEGRPQYTIEDVYPVADLIAYPSEYEGFGNAFLEAIYFKKPIVCNRYTIYRTDIEPCGFRTILFDEYLTPKTIHEVRRVLEDDEYREEMVEHNYQLGAQYFGYDVVEDELRSMMKRPQNIYRLIGRRND